MLVGYRFNWEQAHNWTPDFTMHLSPHIWSDVRVRLSSSSPVQPQIRSRVAAVLRKRMGNHDTKA